MASGPSRRALMSGFVGGTAALGAGALFASDAMASDSAVVRKPGGGKVREYWLQVESVVHDVIPTHFDQMMGEKITVRSKIQALVYRAYSRNWGHVLPGSADLGPNTGFPGPVLRAEVGDQIVVHLRNHDMYYKQPHSVHPHGVRYAPASDGAWTAVHTKPGSAVPFGQTYTYTYDALPSSVGTWIYHDHSVPFLIAGAGASSTADSGMSMDMGADAPTPVMELGAELGLMGHVIVTEPGEKRPDREFYLIFHDIYADDVAGIDGDLDCFNGLAFLGNTPTFEAKVGEHVRWHVVALGTEFHVFHVHGHRWIGPGGGYTDSVLLGPSTSVVADYIEDNPGQWLYHCHVVDHMMGGMIGWYNVTA